MDTEPTSEARLRHQLTVQSRQINRVLRSHRVPATVAGGEVRPKVVSFDLQTQIAAGLERIRDLKSDLMSALGVGDIALVQNDGQWRLRVNRPDDPPVPLLRLLASIPPLPPRTAVIGLSDGGRPVLMPFSTKKLSHVLITGEPGAGKTSLLRAIAAGLALQNRQSDLQLQILDLQWNEKDRATSATSSLLPLGYLPHMLTDPAFGIQSCASIVHFLAEEMAYRRRERIQDPRIVVLMDHTLTYMESAPPEAVSDLLRLLQYGAQAGIHFVLATDRPGSSLLDSTIKACVSMNIIGRMQDAGAARKICGVPLDQAPNLYGEGDFLAVIGDEVTYFQAAYIGDYDLHLKLTELFQSSRPSLLAQPFSARPQVKGMKGKQINSSPKVFTIREGAIDLESPMQDESIDDSNEIPF